MDEVVEGSGSKTPETEFDKRTKVKMGFRYKMYHHYHLDLQLEDSLCRWTLNTYTGTKLFYRTVCINSWSSIIGINLTRDLDQYSLECSLPRSVFLLFRYTSTSVSDLTMLMLGPLRFLKVVDGLCSSLRILSKRESPRSSLVETTGKLKSEDWRS